MSKTRKLYVIASALCATLIASVAHAGANKVVIGDIDDMSGVYADIIGPGGVEAAKMAIADFGGSVLGTKIEFLVTDQIATASPWSWAAPIPASALRCQR
jgi:branched-chain amino acid transport system substrate-binding protein